MGLDVPALGELAVSIFVPKDRPATVALRRRARPYTSPRREFHGDTVMALDTAARRRVVLAAGREVMAPRQTGAIVAFGDSIRMAASRRRAPNPVPDESRQG